VLIETPRLKLRRYLLQDLDAFHRIVSDPLTMAFWPAPFKRDQARAWIERAIAGYQQHGYGRMPVSLKATGEQIGDCGAMPAFTAGRPIVDFGWIIDRHHWQQGYAVEAAAAVRDYLFTLPAVARLHAHMAWNHVASRRVAEKIG